MGEGSTEGSERGGGAGECEESMDLQSESGVCVRRGCVFYFRKKKNGRSRAPEKKRGKSSDLSGKSQNDMRYSDLWSVPSYL
ncbi:hypothetical protein TNIN_349261 [Trichonephila inaurata madagascariensis]|uniref:Uncharacterized protein n=1 Tax=Trichonephila inaurata madagascariensis TaxID=2747483 RepID=A0A8X6YLS2_9ARAC|nr:hypothetical protein TNIN_349261 [Trichonephila inaurata madagascariensis]